LKNYCLTALKLKKEVTIYDIAEELNLSPSTISRGLRDHPLINPETRRRINETARALGYQQNTFASNLRMNRSNTIGVVVPRLDSYFMSTVISGMEKVVNQHGYNLIINQSGESVSKEVSCINTMYNSRVDGLLISLASDTVNLDHLKLIREKEIPLIFFDRTEPDCNCSVVRIDNFRAGYEVTSHLIERGCRNIIMVCGNLLRNVYKDRFLGYRQALKDFGIPEQDKLIFPNSIHDAAVEEIVEKIVRAEIPADGIFTSNDSSAVEITMRLKQKGYRIPEDIAVAGFNNDPISKVIEPNLTTVAYPGAEVGEIAAGRLIEMINSRDGYEPMEVIVPHRLLIRDSTAKGPENT